MLEYELQTIYFYEFKYIILNGVYFNEPIFNTFNHEIQSIKIN